MRIISGQHKGRRLIAPKKLPVRPTTDQAKEALFNILANRYDFEELSVLDLFAGIGSISFEFSSRGTTNITSVDRYYDCLKFIRKTAKELEADLNIIKSDAFSFLSKALGKYDLIFADPPYDFPDEQFEKIIHSIFENQFLKSEGILIVEHSKHTDLSHHPQHVEDRRYGSTVFSFFEAPFP